MNYTVFHWIPSFCAPRVRHRPRRIPHRLHWFHRPRPISHV